MSMSKKTGKAVLIIKALIVSLFEAELRAKVVFVQAQYPCLGQKGSGHRFLWKVRVLNGFGIVSTRLRRVWTTKISGT